MNSNKYLDAKTLIQLREEHPEISSQTWHKVADRMAGGLIRLTRVRYGGATAPEDTKSMPMEKSSYPGNSTKAWVSPDLLKMGIVDFKEAPVKVKSKAKAKSQAKKQELKEIFALGKTADISEKDIKEVQDSVTGNTDQLKEMIQNVDSLKLSAVEKKETLDKIELQREELVETQNEMKEEMKKELGTKWKDAWAALVALAEIVALFLKKSWETIWNSIKYIFDVSSTAGAKLMSQVVTEDSFLRRMLNKVGTGIKIVGNAVWSGIKALGSVVMTLFPTAVSLATWISTNPQTSRMTLIMIRILKRKMCKELGLWWTTTQEERRNNSTLAVEDIGFGEVFSELQGPLLAKVTSGVLKSQTLSKSLESVGKLAAKAMGGFPIIGGFLSGIRKSVV